MATRKGTGGHGQEAMALLWGFWRGEDAYGSELSRVVSNLISKRVPAENVGDIARELAYVLDAASTLTVFAIEHVQELGVSREVAMRQLEDEVERRAAELFG